MTRAYTGIRGVVLALAQRTIGMSTAEVPGRTIRQVARAVQGLLDQGVVHRGKASSKVVRFFADKRNAEAYEDAAAINRHAESKEAAAGVAPWPADAPTHYPTDANGVPTWKLTVCPGGEAPSNSPAMPARRTPDIGDDY